MKRTYLTNDFELKISTVKKLRALSAALNSVIEAISEECGDKVKIQRIYDTPAGISEIVNSISDFCGFDITTKSRQRQNVRVRFAACYVLRKHEYSLTQIGWALGKRDHTTVMHALGQANDLMANNLSFVDLVKRIEERLSKTAEAA